MHNNAVWDKWMKAHFDDEADYNEFCWVWHQIEKCYG